MIKIIIFMIILYVILSIFVFIALSLKQIIKRSDVLCDHDWEILEETTEKKINNELKLSPLMPFHVRSKKYNQISYYACNTTTEGFHDFDTEKTYVETNNDLYNMICKICGKEDFQIKRYIRACKAFYDMK